VSPEELLRKPKTRSQKARFPAQLEAFRDEARGQVEFFGRTKFEGPVSVAIDIHVPEGRQQPLMHDVVKAYLDALQGIAYDDDRQVEHLVVHRRGTDHPMLSTLQQREEPREGQVFIVVQPLVAYTRLYDRTFRRLIFRRRERSPFRNEWTPRDDLKLAVLRAERARMPEGRDPGPTDELIGSYEEQRLTGSALADVDRPGPLSDDMRRAFRIFPAHRVHAALRAFHGSTFLLPLPGEGPGTSDAWSREVEEVIARHRGHRFMTQHKLSTWVALDIAVRGESVDGKDLDNLARSIIPRFEEAFCVQPGTVACYRAYQAVGSPTGVQVRVLHDTRMLGLEIALGETRSGLVDMVHGPHESRRS
jgi:Holliday junction resolvase RusA-like endonuclease